MEVSKVEKKKFEFQLARKSLCNFENNTRDRIVNRYSHTVRMSAEEAVTNGSAPAERTTIGISFGNSNSSIAYTTAEDKAEVIANEDGGMCS